MCLLLAFVIVLNAITSEPTTADTKSLIEKLQKEVIFTSVE
jgi:hypothetical protein